MSATILLADDHTIVREGLCVILRGLADVKVVAQASTGVEAVELAKQLCPDVVVMDVGMRDLNGVEATRRIVRADHLVKVVALSAYAERAYVEAMLRAGASAYVVKAEAAEELVKAIREVMAGRRYLCALARAALEQQVAPTGTPLRDVLTSRELQVVQLVAEGHATRVIAEKLGISEATVEVHRRNLMKKLGLRNVAEVTRAAIREGLTSA